MADFQLHQRLGYKVSRLSRIMQSRLERLIAEQGLTRLMWCVLTGIGDEGVSTPSELADYIGITRPATSRLLREMGGQGHGFTPWQRRRWPRQDRFDKRRSARSCSKPRGRR